MKATLVGGPWDGRDIDVSDPPPVTICTTAPPEPPGSLPAAGWESPTLYYNLRSSAALREIALYDYGGSS